MKVKLKTYERVQNDPRIREGSGEVYPTVMTSGGWFHKSQYGAIVKLNMDNLTAVSHHVYSICDSNQECKHNRGYGYPSELLMEDVYES